MKVSTAQLDLLRAMHRDGATCKAVMPLPDGSQETIGRLKNKGLVGHDVERTVARFTRKGRKFLMVTDGLNQKEFPES